MPTSKSLRRGKRADWEKRASHQAARVDLIAPVEIDLNLPLRKKFEDAIYIFDQLAAHRRLPYYVESVSGNRYYGYTLRILVSRQLEHLAREINTQLNPPKASRRAVLNTGFWTSLLSPGDRGFNGWHAALYVEYAAQRTDGMNYIAFLFRDERRRQFGIQEFLGKDTGEIIRPLPQWRELAISVNRDAALRNKLLSDDPDLPKMWRRH